MVFRDWYLRQFVSILGVKQNIELLYSSVKSKIDTRTTKPKGFRSHFSIGLYSHLATRNQFSFVVPNKFGYTVLTPVINDNWYLFR